MQPEDEGTRSFHDEGHVTLEESETSQRRYDSFVLRMWRGGAALPRLEVEHIQSGRSSHLGNLADVLGWLQERLAEGAHSVA